MARLLLVLPSLQVRAVYVFMHACTCGVRGGTPHRGHDEAFHLSILLTNYVDLHASRPSSLHLLCVTTSYAVTLRKCE